MEVNRAEKPVRMMLPSVLDLGEADDLLATLRELQSAPDPYAIDGSAVTRLATPCLQILLSAIKGREAVNLVGPSLTLLETIEDLGLTAQFEERIVLE